MFGKKSKDEIDKEKEERKQQEIELQQQKKKDEEGPGGIGEMKRGDYMIHVFLEKGKDFKVPEDSTVDPMLEVTSLGAKEYSSAKDDIGGVSEVTWLEHVFLEAQNVEKKTAEEGKIKLRLVDKGLFKNALIGEFEFDVSQIYFKKDHALLHKWIALSDPYGDNYSEITGYLKVSISVTCTGDEAIQINEDNAENEDTEILMPPSLNPTFYQIKIRIFQAQQLPIMDNAWGGLREEKTDAYLITQYKKKKLRTNTVVYKNRPIDWNQEIWYPAQYPVIQNRIVVKLMDEDEIVDEIVGSLFFNVTDILDGEYQKKNHGFRWINVYGSPMGQSDSAAKRQMNENPEVASFWKGRVLIQVDCEKTEKPVAKVEDIDDEYIMKAQDYLVMKHYRIVAEVGQCVALPEPKKYTVKLIVGGVSLQTQLPKISESNYNRFNERMIEDKQLPYQMRESFGCVIICLMDEDQPVCFYRQDVKEFLAGNAEYKWVLMKPDPAVGKVTDPNKAGMISFKLSIFEHNDGAISDLQKAFKAWKNPPPPRAQAVKIRAYIYQCRDLPAADDNGASDAYIVVWDKSSKQKRTKTIEDNMNPLFYQTLELEYEVRNINDLLSYPPFIVDVWDEDKELFDSTDDFLGRAVIEPEDCAIVTEDMFGENGLNEIPSKPKWHPIHYQEGEPKCGEVLISFAVAQIDYNFQPSRPESVDLKGLVPMDEMDVDMCILGLRQLESPGILPIKKAYIQFNISSLVPPNTSSIQNIQTQPGPPGPNPTINTTMKFSIPLPTDPHYCPKLTCFVFDNIFMGLSQAQVGTFIVPIGDLMVALKEERKTETEALKLLNAKLRAMIKGEEYNVPDYGSNALQSSSSAHGSNRRTGADVSVNVSDTFSERDEGESFAMQIEDDANRSLLAKTGNKSNKQLKNLLDKSSNQQPQVSMTIIKKQQNKAFKGSKNAKDYGEDFDANAEEEGNIQANNQRNNLLNQINKRKQQLMKAGGDPEMQDQARAGRFTPLGSKKKKLDLPADGDNKLARLSKKERLAVANADKEQKKRMIEDERVRAEEEAIEKGDDVAAVIQMPKYELDRRLKVDREVNKPNENLYIGLGWDENSTTKRRHYRQYYPDELENITSIFPRQSPFESFVIKKGQSRGLDSSGVAGFFSNLFKTFKKDESGVASSEKVVGYFKGIIQVQSKTDKERYEKTKEKLIAELIKNVQDYTRPRSDDGKGLVVDVDSLALTEERKKFDLELRKYDLSQLEITKCLAELNSDEILKKSLLAQHKCIVRLYMIEAFNLSSRDNGSPSDPYVWLKCNDKVYNERDNYQLDQPNPKFFKHYDFEGLFPGCSPVEICIYDYDDIFGDDLIGKSILDVEDRYFTYEWQGLEHKPVEYRQIYHQCSSQEQGVVKCWLEINSALTPPEDIKLWDISEKPPETLEIRVCVFNCKEVEMMDYEGTVDAYCRGFFDSKEDVQETDTHYRNQDGKPDFQYRLVYRIEVPRKDYKFTIQMYDRDFFKSNDIIGEAQINLKQLIEDCTLVKKPLQLNKSYYDTVLTKNGRYQKLEFDSDDSSRFWMQMRHKNPKTHREETRGMCKIQVDVLPLEMAEKNPVGKARDEPNHSPKLPEPEGRITLSLNPFDMYKQLIGPEIRRKICMYIICIACLALYIALIPTFGGSVIANMLNDAIKGLFGGGGSSN